MSNYSNWSVIVQTGLASSYVGQQLRQKGVKIKRAESVLDGSVIFPKAKVAFLVLEVTKKLLSQFFSSNSVSQSSDRYNKSSSYSKDMSVVCGNREAISTERCSSDGTGDVTMVRSCEESTRKDATMEYTGVLARVDKFTRIHGHCYILLQAPLFTERELAFLYHLQTRYLSLMSGDVLPAHSAEECVSAMLTISSLQTPPTSDTLNNRFCQLMNDLVKPLSKEVIAALQECGKS